MYTLIMLICENQVGVSSIDVVPIANLDCKIANGIVIRLFKMLLKFNGGAVYWSMIILIVGNIIIVSASVVFCLGLF